MADDKDRIIADQAALIERLSKRLDAVESRLPPEEAPPVPPGTKLAFPAVVYQRGHRKGQIDHPGNLTKIVVDEADLASAIADGWSKDPFEHLDLDEAEELAGVAKKSKKSKAA